MATESSIRDTFYWFVEGERIGIVEKKTTSTTGLNKDPDFESPHSDSAGKVLRVHYTAKASDFTTVLSNSSELPNQFHEALAFKVISDLYKLPGDNTNLQLAQYYDQQYALALREAKKYARRQHVQGGVIVPHSF